jgi:hypothetical protein
MVDNGRCRWSPDGACHGGAVRDVLAAAPVAAHASSPDRPFFREQSYHALNRQNAARWADLGTYRARPSILSQSADPSPRLSGSCPGLLPSLGYEACGMSLGCLARSGVRADLGGRAAAGRLRRLVSPLSQPVPPRLVYRSVYGNGVPMLGGLSIGLSTVWRPESRCYAQP